MPGTEPVRRGASATPAQGRTPPPGDGNRGITGSERGVVDPRPRRVGDRDGDGGASPPPGKSGTGANPTGTAGDRDRGVLALLRPPTCAQTDGAWHYK